MGIQGLLEECTGGLGTSLEMGRRSCCSPWPAQHQGACSHLSGAWPHLQRVSPTCTWGFTAHPALITLAHLCKSQQCSQRLSPWPHTYLCHNSLIKSYLKPNAKRHHAQCWLKYLPSFIAFRKDRSRLFQSCSALFAEGEQCKCLALQKTADLLDEQLKP